MIRSCRRRQTGALLATLGGIACASALAASPVHAESRALLIGINRYPSEEIPDLRGAVNDVEMMTGILVDRYGFARESIRVLTDGDATREGILAALREAVRVTEPGDVLYVHYSGHGSQVEDRSGDEDDGLDETLIPHDGRTGDVADITDDELHGILSGLRTDRAVIVLDSCHSGTATRGVAFRTRSVPADRRVNLYDALGTRSIVPLEKPERYVLLTGAASNEAALDGPLPPGQADRKPHGLFTYAFGQVLLSAPSGATVDRIHAGVVGTLERIDEQIGGAGHPDPQFEGSPARLRRALFPASGAPGGEAVRERRMETKARGPKHVLLRRGRTLGASVGSYWAVAGPPRDGAPPVLVRVVGYEGAHAVAVSTGVAPPPRGRAKLVLPAGGDGPVTLHVRGLEDLLREELIGAVRKRIPVKVVEDQRLAKFVVALEDEAVRLLGGATGEELASFGTGDVAGSAEQLAEALERSSLASVLLSLTNPGSFVSLDARLAVPRDILYLPRAGEAPTPATHLQLEVATDTAGYLTIVDVDPGGGVNLLFPNEWQDPEFLPGGYLDAGAPVRIPDSLSEDNAAGFRWPLQPPVGRETIQVFLMTDYAAAEELRASIRSGSMTTRGADGRRPRLESLRLGLARLAARGVGVVPSRPQGSGGPFGSAPLSMDDGWGDAGDAFTEGGWGDDGESDAEGGWDDTAGWDDAAAGDDASGWGDTAGWDDASAGDDATGWDATPAVPAAVSDWTASSVVFEIRE